MTKYPTQKDPNYGTHQYCPPFTPMIEVLAAGREGDFVLDTVELTAEQARLVNMHGMFQGFDEKAAPGKFMRLRDKDYLWMSDAPRERWSNLEFIRRAHGHVLAAGLGIGMVIPPLLAKKDKGEVKSVMIVEKEPDVIRLVGAQFSGVGILQGDINTWRPARNIRFNTIWLDIWSDICSDNWPEVVHLRRVFTNYLDRRDPDRWCGAWEYEYLKYLVRRERNE